jgi:(p)ppGpp synthase/HD superfamily hydrolase
MPGFAKELPTTSAAVAYAETVHAGLRRRVDDAPFVLHPLDVASLLHDIGGCDELIAAGVLHDTIEKTPVTACDLRSRFGGRVAALVLTVTEDKEIKDYAKRKAALREQVARADDEALMLFAADKLSKVRELRVAVSRPPRRRLAHYRHSLQLLQALLPDCALTSQLATELKRIPASAGKAARTGAR